MFWIYNTTNCFDKNSSTSCMLMVGGEIIASVDFEVIFLIQIKLFFLSNGNTNRATHFSTKFYSLTQEEYFYRAVNSYGKSCHKVPKLKNLQKIKKIFVKSWFFFEKSHSIFSSGLPLFCIFFLKKSKKSSGNPGSLKIFKNLENFSVFYI